MGVLLSSAQETTIGGTAAEAGNRISGNGTGVAVHNTAGGHLRNSILSNSIHSNGDVGIDLNWPGGVTPNDPNDPDTGPNELQNFRVLTSATRNPGSGQRMVAGALDTDELERRIQDRVLRQ